MTRRDNQRGASFVEVLIAAMLISIALVPMLDAMQAASFGAEQQQQHSVRHYLLVAKVEEVLAEPHTSLIAEAAAAGGPSAATAYSDAGGTTNRRLVFLSPYDGDNADADNDPFTGTDSGLIWVRVEIEGATLAIESLAAQ